MLTRSISIDAAAAVCIVQIMVLYPSIRRRSCKHKELYVCMYMRVISQLHNDGVIILHGLGVRIHFIATSGMGKKKNRTCILFILYVHVYSMLDLRSVLLRRCIISLAAEGVCK